MADGQIFDAVTLTGVPEGYEPQILAEKARALGLEQPAAIIHVARDDRRLDAIEQGLSFFAPKLRTVVLPAWDTVPYDRVSPSNDLVARRITALSKLVIGGRKEPVVVLTTVNAVLQRLPPPTFVRKALRKMAPGQRADMNRLISRLQLGGYSRSGMAMDPGDFAVRGGILDVYPPGRTNPIRLDFFGDTIESIKSFDAQTQITAKPIQKMILMPMSEVAFDEEAINRFRQNYIALFGGNTGDDPMYQAITAGHRHQGMEHWLPLFHGEMATLFDYVGTDAVLSFDENAEAAIKQRFEQIGEHYDGRVDGLEQDTFGAPPYKPIPPEQMYMSGREWAETLTTHPVFRLSQSTESAASQTEQIGGRIGKTFVQERQGRDGDLIGSVIGHMKAAIVRKQRVVIACWTSGSRERLVGLIRDRGFDEVRVCDSFDTVRDLPGHLVGAVILGIERGFETEDLLVIGEQDVLGDRLVRKTRKKKKATDVIADAASLDVGDLVVHADHGIGRFVGLKTIDALGAPHDCLELEYHAGDRLYLPVENLELLSRYGSDADGMQLDRLGGAAWQSRKAKLRKRLMDIAADLIQIAAMRELKQAPVLEPPTGAYDEFVAKFPYDETDDQLSSIDAVIEDLGSGKPMDRLVCGDVGFGKTEVAMRAAFVAALAGLQVAVVVPTTLLARQHYRSFKERFSGLPVEIAQASRLVGAKELSAVKQGLAEGRIDIVVGTHALLSKAISFDRLGLLIIDEEQRFGVNHKERLKKLREDIHVLTLSATPIPRTLQLALTGVRELSMITTPPVDRLAVRSYVSPFDPVILRDALRRERYRGGQTYFVVPRIKDLGDMVEFLSEVAPELRVATAHGQLNPTELEDIMTAFYEGQYDVLLSTTIVESGLDVPNANTLIVHRADMFGLAQLYQLRGRVGRSKKRAYAYFTTTPGVKLNPTAEKRLQVMKSLDSLGAGFALASHDLDIRGGGNLLGEDQSGHIKEVGFELYQSMLEEAIQALKAGDLEEHEAQWSPQIALGVPTLIPETYVSDLQLRLTLYRRLSKLETRSEIDEFVSELADRFGPPPSEVTGLMDVMEIKGLCRQAGVEKIDAGPKGAVISFRGNEGNAEAIVRVLQKAGPAAKLQPDHKLVYKSNWDTPAKRFRGMRKMLMELIGKPADKAVV
ncbi:MAG: transcription-repair coupling factor [Pseudomonadota bacterium]